MKKNKINQLPLGLNYIILVIISLTALVATFAVANLDLGFEMKTAIFIAIVSIYLILFVTFYIVQKRRAELLLIEEKQRLAESEIENRLLALEEVSEFFGASLKFPDIFRLISSRINELIPFTTCALFLVDEKKANLKIVSAVGENSRNLLNYEIDIGEGLAGNTFIEQSTKYEEKILLDRFVIPDVGIKGLETGLAVPLFHKGNVFGVLTLYGNKDVSFSQSSIQLLQAVATRVAPLFMSSMMFERSVSNALTDSLTNLPNERAFFLVLENQIAESARYRDERLLTVLTIDIKKFTELNQKFGHTRGDQILTFAAKLIKGQLRQMDFLSRANGDEFLAVLPTSSEATALEIIARIEKKFTLTPFEFSAREKTPIQLNFGAASFGKDGETAKQLIHHAQLRKKQTKTGHNNKVLWFPKEYVS